MNVLSKNRSNTYTNSKNLYLLLPNYCLHNYIPLLQFVCLSEMAFSFPGVVFSLKYILMVSTCTDEPHRPRCASLCIYKTLDSLRSWGRLCFLALPALALFPYFACESNCYGGYILWIILVYFTAILWVNTPRSSN